MEKIVGVVWKNEAVSLKLSSEEQRGAWGRVGTLMSHNLSKAKAAFYVKVPINKIFKMKKDGECSQITNISCLALAYQWQFWFLPHKLPKKPFKIRKNTQKIRLQS